MKKELTVVKAMSIDALPAKVWEALTGSSYGGKYMYALDSFLAFVAVSVFRLPEIIR